MSFNINHKNNSKRTDTDKDGDQSSDKIPGMECSIKSKATGRKQEITSLNGQNTPSEKCYVSAPNEFIFAPLS